MIENANQMQAIQNAYAQENGYVGMRRKQVNGNAEDYMEI